MTCLGSIGYFAYSNKMLDEEFKMPIIDHSTAPEVPWRPNYRKWAITQEGDGTTSSNVSHSTVGVGTGAPLHTHEADEIIVVLRGTLKARLGDVEAEVSADHTLVIPPNVPHGFTNEGTEEAKILTFFPVQRPFEGTHFLEGEPPSVHS